MNLRYVTQGSLKIPRKQFNLESGQIKFSLKIQDSAWEPRQGLDQWDVGSRTFIEVSVAMFGFKILICTTFMPNSRGIF